MTAFHNPRPYTGIAAPVTSSPASPASHTIRLATEAGCTHVDVSAPGMSLRLAGVSMVPGRITLAVMPASLFSSATVRISETSAGLGRGLSRDSDVSYFYYRHVREHD